MSGRVVALRFEVITVDAVASWSSVSVVRGKVVGLGAGSTAVPVFYNTDFSSYPQKGTKKYLFSLIP